MRKLKLQVQISIDGFIAGPNGELDWMEWNWDDALKQYIADLTEPVDCIILGRTVYKAHSRYLLQTKCSNEWNFSGFLSGFP